MNSLESLGFFKYRTVSERLTRDFGKASGWHLPEAYVAFLEYHEPKGMPLNFRFFATAGDEWEGQVSEFFEIAPQNDDLTGLSDRVHVRSGIAYLPIACDAGGNYLYMVVTKPNGPVVDLEAHTGNVVEVAPTFEAFLEKLYPSEET